MLPCVHENGKTRRDGKANVGDLGLYLVDY